MAIFGWQSRRSTTSHPARDEQTAEQPGEPAQATYFDALFESQLEEGLAAPGLDDLIRGIGSGNDIEDLVRGNDSDKVYGTRYVRKKCYDRKAEIATYLADPLASYRLAQERVVVARRQQRGLSGLLQPVVLQPALRRLLMIVALATCATSFLWASPGPAVRDGFDGLTVTLAIVLALVAVTASLTEMLRGPSAATLITAATALPASIVAFVASVSDIATVARPSSGNAVAVVSALGAFVGIGVVMAFQQSPGAQPISHALLPVSVGRIAQMLAGAGIALPLATLLISVGKVGTSFRTFDIQRPPLIATAAGLSLYAVLTFAAFATLWTIPRKKSEAEWREAEALAKSALRDQIIRIVRELYDEQEPKYEHRFVVSQVTGMSQTFDPVWEVPTEAMNRLGDAMRSMPGGSIGVAGPRGVGKSTVLASYCGEGGEAALKVLVSAPVEYSSREFLLHLYAQVCRATVRHSGIAAAAPDPIGTIAHRRAVLSSYAMIGALGLAGLVLLLGAAIGFIVSTVQLAGVVLVVVALGLILQNLLRQEPSVRDTLGAGRPLESLAIDRLHEIEYQQTLSGEISGAVKLPAALETSIKRGLGLVRQPKTLPEIVDSFREFLGLAAEAMAAKCKPGQPAVVIGIDELDKIESEVKAQLLLNDIKSVFGVRNCYFLVSVSEDAMASFERRGLPFRDVFDSAFDDIIAVEPLNFRACSSLIGRRTPKIPVPFKGLCFALSGGLPRDLIRATRAMAGLAQQMQKVDDHDTVPLDMLTNVAHRLFTEDVRGKAVAVAAAIRKTDREPATSSMIEWCSTVHHAVYSCQALIGAMRQLDKIPFPAASDSDATDFRTLRRLVWEMAAYAFYAGTVVEFFTDARTKEDWRQASTKDNRSGFDTLAEARRMMSFNPLVGWTRVATFRRSWRLAEIAPPVLDERGLKIVNAFGRAAA